MSNGLFEEVKDIMESGEIPQKVSNRLLMASMIENRRKTNKNSEDIKSLQMSDKKWGGFAMLVSVVGVFLRRE